MATGLLSQTHAAKSEALRRMLGTGGNAVLHKMPVEGGMRRASVFTRPSGGSAALDAPPGLGNWDNSCYQNSVLQGLASLESLKLFLGQSQAEDAGTSGSLLETVMKLNDAENNGKQLWTPAKLKNMSSWQQQDAQEYFSKIMDELDKEAAKTVASSISKAGLESIVESPGSQSEGSKTMDRTATGSGNWMNASVTAEQTMHNPLEGLLAQKVTCTRCGFSEGLSMIPFNCLTVPLGSNFAYDLEECLDEYTKLEEINEVECAKCTLFRAEKQFQQMLPAAPGYQASDAVPAVDSKMLALPPELRAQGFKRLAAIQRALGDDDFEDKTLNETCQIPKKGRVSSTKTRQAVVGRAPKSLVIHVNRSVFNEITGEQRKNYASVRWPATLDLSSWFLDEGAVDSMLSDDVRRGGKGGAREVRYRIKAVVTHYGRHENGHYICYRQHPVRPQPDSVVEEGAEEKGEVEETAGGAPETRWWRLSDEDVSSASEADVLGQGGVFMLFYEHEDTPEKLAPADNAHVEAAEIAQQEALRDFQPNAADLVDEAAAIPLPETADLDLEQQIEESLATTQLHEPEVSSSSLPSSKDAESTTEDESEADVDTRASSPVPPVQKPHTPSLMMRTARGSQAAVSEKLEGFGGGALRAVAAT